MKLVFEYNNYTVSVNTTIPKIVMATFFKKVIGSFAKKINTTLHGDSDSLPKMLVIVEDGELMMHFLNAIAYRMPQGYIPFAS